jgi:hypothetical protein
MTPSCRFPLRAGGTAQHLFQHILHAAPAHQPYCVALDGTTVPRTGAYIPGAHWTPNPTNARSPADCAKPTLHEGRLA